MQDAGLLKDDSSIVQLTSFKYYCGECAWHEFRLRHEGAIIEIVEFNAIKEAKG